MQRLYYREPQYPHYFSRSGATQSLTCGTIKTDARNPLKMRSIKIKSLELVILNDLTKKEKPHSNPVFYFHLS